MSTLQALDYTAIIIYMVLMAGIGLSLGFFVRDVAAYFKGGSTIPWYVGGISNFMTLFSTFVFVAHAGIAYDHGLVALIVIWCTVPATLIGAYVFAHRWRRAGISSPVEFLEERFSGPVRQLFSWGGIGFRVLDNMVRLYALGIFLSTATPLDLETSVWLAGLIVVLYTMVGGLWAVVLTDTIQFVILMAATIILVPLSLQAVGGLQRLVEQVPEHFTLFNGPKGHWTFLLVYYLMFTLKNNGNWAFIQRFYSVRDEAAGRKMGLLTAGLFLVFPIFFLLQAIVAKVLIPELEDGEMAYVSIALQLLPEGVMGIMLAAMFAATMSSLSSEYNVMASVITGDIYQRLIRPQAGGRELMLVARSTTFLVGILVIFGALFVGAFGGAFEASKLFTSLFAVPLVIPVLFGVLLKKANATGAALSLILGVFTGLMLNYLPDVSWQAATFITMLVSICTFLASALWTKYRTADRDRMEGFFRKLQLPVPDNEKPVIAADFQRVLLLLFLIALAATGLLFLIMSFPSVGEFSGRLAMLAGGICLALAGLFYFWLRSNHKPTMKP